MYTETQKNEIEKVIQVFRDYINNDRGLDIVWSDKAGYVLLDGINTEKNEIIMAPEIITSGRQLCDYLIWNVICKTLKANGKTTDTLLWGQEEKAIIHEALKPFWEQLPEYADLEDDFFSAE